MITEIRMCEGKRLILREMKEDKDAAVDEVIEIKYEDDKEEEQDKAKENEYCKNDRWKNV